MEEALFLVAGGDKEEGLASSPKGDRDFVIPTLLEKAGRAAAPMRLLVLVEAVAVVAVACFRLRFFREASDFSFILLLLDEATDQSSPSSSATSSVSFLVRFLLFWVIHSFLFALVATYFSSSLLVPLIVSYDCEHVVFFLP